MAKLTEYNKIVEAINISLDEIQLKIISDLATDTNIDYVPKTKLSFAKALLSTLHDVLDEYFD